VDWEGPSVRRAILVLALCQVIWSFGGVVIRWTTLPVTTLIPLALLASGTFLALTTPRRRLRLPSWKLRAEAAGFGLANGVCNVLTGFAITMAGIGNAAFGFASLPLWLVLFARPLVGDRVPLRAVPALGLGGVGIGLLLLSSRGGESGDQVFLGMILAIAAGIVGSISALAGRRLVPAIGVQATATWTMLTGGLMLTPLIDWGAVASVALWTLPVLLAWVGMHFILAPVLYNRMSILAPAFMLAVATFINPSVAPVWGAIFYGESVTLLAVAGLALALSANVLLLVLMRAPRIPSAVPVPELSEPVLLAETR
jgi:drug/metabolite transporter (DMT)-like permease